MAVIINDLEVVLEPPKPPTNASRPAQQPPPQQQPFTPQDYLTLLDRQKRNSLRLRAH